MAKLVHASRLLPEPIKVAAFSRAGAAEAISPKALADVKPDRFGRWVTESYGRRRFDAVAIGSSNGAVAHLCAAMEVPWLPQTFLVPVRRSADPDDCVSDYELATQEAGALLSAQPGLAIHQMHDPNQDRLMVRHIAYFRMKMRALVASYRRYLRQCLPPGGTILVVDDRIRWPVTRRGARHVYQHGAVGGIAPEEYEAGSPRVDRFLAEEDADVRAWEFPPVTEWVPEAEWGYDAALTADIRAFAAQHGYRVAHLSFESPESISPVVAEVYRDWYDGVAAPTTRLLVETFICTEPSWALATRTVPLWLTFGTEPSLDTFSKYLATGSGFEEILITLFSHGVRSAGYAAADRWLQVAAERGVRAELVDVDPDKWPVDFATLSTYADTLYNRKPPGDFPPPLPLASAAAAVNRFGSGAGVEWMWE